MTGNSIDIVVDLETAGQNPGCSIVQIGACSVDGQHKFNVFINPNSCVQVGLKEEPETMAWWAKQDPELKARVFGGTVDIVQALGQFSDWLRSLPGQVFIWGNGADFDISILKAAYKQVFITVPWNYKNTRCYRTVKNLYFDVKQGDFEGVKHDALADAVNEAQHLRNILRKHFSRQE